MGKESRSHISNKTWTEVVADYAGKDLGERKHWYGSVASAYNRVRPRYPQAVIDRVIELAQLPPKSQNPRIRLWSCDRDSSLCSAWL